MDSRNRNDDQQQKLDQEADRYREAAASALGQLEWIVGYFEKIGKRDIARALDRNRQRISETTSGLG